MCAQRVYEALAEFVMACQITLDAGQKCRVLIDKVI